MYSTYINICDFLFCAVQKQGKRAWQKEREGGRDRMKEREPVTGSRRIITRRMIDNSFLIRTTHSHSLEQQVMSITVKRDGLVPGWHEAYGGEDTVTDWRHLYRNKTKRLTVVTGRSPGNCKHDRSTRILLNSFCPQIKTWITGNASSEVVLLRASVVCTCARPFPLDYTSLLL